MDEQTLLTLQEVRNAASVPWVVVDGRVLDLSRWIHHHPGGDLALRRFAGTDCTDEFHKIHSKRAIAMLPMFTIGQISRVARL